MRDFRKLKTLDDWKKLDSPMRVPDVPVPWPDIPSQMILRMLVRPKYRGFHIPAELNWIEGYILSLAEYDARVTGIKNSWCYVTVRSGMPRPTTDEWHFDGGSLRTELIPERNYVWADKFPMQYKLGGVEFPSDFDPLRHNMFEYAERETADEPIRTADEPIRTVDDTEHWYLLSPFCLHRRDPASTGHRRCFIRVSFVDIEIRDANCTQNPDFPTEAWGRDPVSSFRDGLETYR